MKSKAGPGFLKRSSGMSFELKFSLWKVQHRSEFQERKCVHQTSYRRNCFSPNLTVLLSAFFVRNSRIFSASKKHRSQRELWLYQILQLDKAGIKSTGQSVKIAEYQTTARALSKQIHLQLFSLLTAHTVPSGVINNHAILCALFELLLCRLLWSSFFQRAYLVISFSEYLNRFQIHSQCSKLVDGTCQRAFN